MKTSSQIQNQTHSRLIPRYSVLLLDDDIHTMDEVLIALTTSVPLCEQEAFEIMLQAHSEGIAVVVTEPLEWAEYHADRLRSYALIVYVEPSE